MADLGGATVGVLEARMGGELASLVRRHAGEPVLAPALLEAELDAAGPVADFVDALTAGEIELVLFLTGVGASALFREADRLGRRAELVDGLTSTINVCRGSKPWRPLRNNGVPVSLTVPEPHTTADVLRTMWKLRPAEKGVALLHYGERSEMLAEALAAWGARLRELCLYEWRLPEDTAPLEAMIRRVIDGDLDAVLFTSRVQVRHLHLVATRMSLADPLVAALDTRTVVAAVGPTCAAALEDLGVRPRVIPAHPKMGAMVVALAAYLGRVDAG